MSLPVLRRLPVPVPEPYPLSRIRDLDSGPRVAATQGTLALQLPTYDVSPRPAAPESRRPVPTSASRTPADDPPEPREWAATFLQAAMEVAAGLRSPTQLIRWTTPEVHETIARRGALAARARIAARTPVMKPMVRTLLMSSPGPGRWEAAGVTTDYERVRAVAFRIEMFDRRWRVTALEVG